MREGQGTLRVALAFAALLGALALVVHRQSRALEELRALDALRSERALLEAERADLAASIQWLESRARVVRDAGRRLGLRVPIGDEIVYISVLPEADPRGAAAVAARSGEAALALGGRP